MQKLCLLMIVIALFMTACQTETATPAPLPTLVELSTFTQIPVVNATPQAIIVEVIITATTNPRLSTPTRIPVAYVVMAVQDIPAGIAITEHQITVLTMPAQFVPLGAFSSKEEVIGLIPRNDIIRETLVLERNTIDIVDDVGREFEFVWVATSDIAANESLDNKMSVVLYSSQTLNLIAPDAIRSDVYPRPPRAVAMVPIRQFEIITASNSSIQP